MKSPVLRFKEFTQPWTHYSLSEIADKKVRWSITGGPFGSNLKSDDYTEFGVRIIQLQNIGDGIFNDAYKIYTSDKKADELASCNIYPNEIIISKMGDPVARCCIVPDKDPRYLMASDGIRLAVNKDVFNVKYIHEYINANSFRKKAFEKSTGSTRKRIGLSDLKGLPIFCPSLKEQQKIASFLSAVDKKIALLTQKHELLTVYKKGVMQKIFNQEIRFKDDADSNYPDWEIKSIKDCAEVIMGQSPSSSSYNQDGDGVFLIQGNADIKNRKIFPRAWTTENTKSCIAGDIILTVRAPVGAVAISDHSGCIGRGVCAIRTNKENSAGYMYQLLVWYESFKWKSLEQGSTFTAVNGNDIKALDCPIPSISEQEKIASFLSTLDDKISNAQKQIDFTKQYKQGLLQQMFI